MNDVEFCIVTKCAVSLNQFDRNRKPELLSKIKLVCSDVCCAVSLERGRGRLDREERELLQEVRELRKKLAARAQSADYTLYSASSHHSQGPGQ